MVWQFAPGSVIGKYRIVRTLARGGMGTTYEAEPGDGGPHVALKELHLSRADDWKIIELFEREARVLRLLTHPAVPACVDHFSVEYASGPAFCLVQQLAPGRSLAELVTHGWRADEAEARRIAQALLDVLDYLHERVPPVYHRDTQRRRSVRVANGAEVDEPNRSRDTRTKCGRSPSRPTAPRSSAAARIPS
jgi:eukaryotic-like serine/threonine-protein kinase